MKAFSPEMFTEQAQTSLKEDAYNLINQKPAIIRSLLEAEDDSIIMEMDARREMYISLLESQQQGLGIIDEAGLGAGFIAAIIAACVAIVGALIALITGSKGGGGNSGGSSSSSSSAVSDIKNSFKQMAASEKETNDQIKSSDTYKGLERVISSAKEDPEFKKTMSDVDKILHKGQGTNDYGHLKDDYTNVSSTYSYNNRMIKVEKRPHSNPFWIKNDMLKVGSNGGIEVYKLRKIAREKTTTIIKYNFPSRNVAEGRLETTKDIAAISKDLVSAFHDLFEFNSETDAKPVDEAIDAIKNKINDISGNIESINTGSTEETTVNAADYLSEEVDYLTHNENGDIMFNRLNPSNEIQELSQSLKQVQRAVNDINIKTTDETRFRAAKQLALDYRSLVLKLCSKVATACTNYQSYSLKDLQQKDTLVMMLSQVGTVDEATIFENASYQNSPKAQEYMFGRDTTIDEDFSEYFQAIEDAGTRFSIYMHENQMRAMNEEALIFSETSISDYEKFQRLQAVNEALGAKIKRGWYNAVAAIKEVFRKFMEKLTANFTTTKNYLDRYKNIILKANFNPKDEYKTQDLDTSINRILNTEAPPFDFNDLVNAECNTPGEFFANVFSKKARLDRPINDQIKFPDANSTMGDINEYFKSYFCMEGHDKTYSGADFQRGINNYFNFLYDIRKINQTIKKSIDNIEDTATKIMKQAGVDVNKPADNAQNNANATGTSAAAPAANAGANATTQANNDSFVYSNLYQKYFTLNENGVLVEADINAGEKPQTPSQGMKNVADKAEGSDDTNAIKNTERSSVDSKVKAYVDVCTGMLRAKMSACEFTRNELMQIIRHHVQAHIGNAAANPQQNNQQQETPPAQDQSTQEKEKDNNAKPTLGQRFGNAVNALRGR